MTCPNISRSHRLDSYKNMYVMAARTNVSYIVSGMDFTLVMYLYIINILNLFHVFKW
jgi:hypothetical protein